MPPKKPFAASWLRLLRRTDEWSPDHSWRSVADQLRKPYPKLARMLDNSEADVLAFMEFPKELRQKLHSTNPLERLNKEIKRRTNVVGIFPNEKAAERLIGAVLLEQNDEWTIANRYMPLEALGKLGQPSTVGITALPMPTE